MKKDQINLDDVPHLEIGHGVLKSVLQDVQTEVVRAKEAAFKRLLAETAVRPKTVAKILTSSLPELTSEIQVKAVEYLADRKVTSAVEVLRDLLSAEEADVRAAAASALGRLDDEKAEEQLIALLVEKDWQVLAAAAGALARIGTVRALSVLQKLPDRRRYIPPRVQTAISEACDAIHARFGDEFAGQLTLDETDESGGLSLPSGAGGDLAITEPGDSKNK